LWEENSFVNFFRIIASGDGLSNYWICRPHPQVGGRKPLFIPVGSNLTLNLTSDLVNPPPIAMRFEETSPNFPCTDLNPPPDGTITHPKESSHCYNLTFHLCGFWVTPTILLLTFNTSKPCQPITTNWCPVSHLYNDGNQHRPPQNRCRVWQGSFPDQWRVCYVMGKASWVASLSAPKPRLHRRTSLTSMSGHPSLGTLHEYLV
ncbi:hypothetical protein HPG69_007407, partial [Diceros bicornis minor]